MENYSAEAEASAAGGQAGQAAQLGQVRHREQFTFQLATAGELE